MEQETKEDMIGIGLAYLGVAILSICLMSGVFGYYPGESITIQNNMSSEILVYTIVGNSTPQFPLIKINSTNITITFPQNMTPDNFHIVFLKETTNEVIKRIYTGGGGGGTRTVYLDKIINQTVYVPEYINKEVPGETIIIDNTEAIEKTSINWLFIIIGLVIGFILAIIWLLKRGSTNTSDKVTEVEE